MYNPAHFDEPRLDALHALVHEQPFGLLVTPRRDGSGIDANGIPFLLEADPQGGPGILRGHVARANPVWRAASETAESLVVFQGPHAYVSPGWYPSKREHGKAVPTWNYAMVQGRGRLRVIDDAAWLRGLVTRLTDRHESTRAERWQVTDAPEAYVESMLKAIVGIEVVLTSLVGKLKASQNRPAADRAGTRAGLAGESGGTAAAAGAQAMAALMERLEAGRADGAT